MGPALQWEASDAGVGMVRERADSKGYERLLENLANGLAGCLEKL